MPDNASSSLLPLQVKDLGFEAGGARLIDSLNLTVAPGRVTVIMGANGAGKSVLLRLLHGLLPAAENSLLWNGQPAGEAVFKRQAMVFQHPVLLRRSVAANLDFVLRLQDAGSRATIRQRRDRLLQAVGLLEHAGQPARLLSGGEQQRLALARAQARQPDILFLDEPTASLDPGSVQIIEQIVLDQHRAGCGIFFVTHDIGQARRLADDIVFLHRGRLAEFTPADKFFQTPQSEPGRAYLAGRLVV